MRRGWGERLGDGIFGALDAAGDNRYVLIGGFVMASPVLVPVALVVGLTIGMAWCVGALTRLAGTPFRWLWKKAATP